MDIIGRSNYEPLMCCNIGDGNHYKCWLVNGELKWTYENLVDSGLVCDVRVLYQLKKIYIESGVQEEVNNFLGKN